MYTYIYIHTYPPTCKRVSFYIRFGSIRKRREATWKAKAKRTAKLSAGEVKRSETKAKRKAKRRAAKRDTKPARSAWASLGGRELPESPGGSRGILDPNLCGQRTILGP